MVESSLFFLVTTCLGPCGSQEEVGNRQLGLEVPGKTRKKIKLKS